MAFLARLKVLSNPGLCDNRTKSGDPRSRDGGSVRNEMYPTAQTSSQPLPASVLLSFIFIFGRGCELFGWQVELLALIAIYMEWTYHVVPWTKVKGNCWSVFLFSSANEFANGVIKIITLLEEQIVVAFPPPPILLSAIF